LLGLRQDLEQLADLALLEEGMPQGKLRLDLVAVPPALSLAHRVALVDELDTIRWAARSVIPTAAAMSRRRMPGS
jgi:hypothetical protein